MNKIKIFTLVRFLSQKVDATRGSLNPPVISRSNDNFKKRIDSLSDIITSKIMFINGLVRRNAGRGLIG